jgi:hypothetical protein
MQFHVINKKPSGDENVERYRTDFYFDDNDVKGEALKCPVCGEFISMLVSLPPYHVHLETWGEDFGDVAFWLKEFLVSRRFRDEYKKSGLKGLASFEPVEIISQKRFGKSRGKKLKPPEYFRVFPTIGAAKIDLAASGVVWKGENGTTCNHCQTPRGEFKSWQRIVVDENSWNGDDIFYAFGISGQLLASARFFEWAKSHEFRNLILKPALECTYDFYPAGRA